jgi:hypothetical protein
MPMPFLKIALILALLAGIQFQACAADDSQKAAYPNKPHF